MTDAPDNLVLEQLRYIRADIGSLRDDMRDIKQRMTTLEIVVGNLAGAEASHYAMTAVRADRVDGRLDRIEKRLELADA
ncbi:MAG: hypothetical protein USCAAHI_01056 [Beijerinckiaceae bacterium]|nr:MAG: hypothetical protein USCAAHI_01056 [Beijerinckiaceae bacterium]